MIASFQGHKAGGADAGGKTTPFIEWLHGVVAAVQHQGRNVYARQQIGDVDVIDDLAQAHRVRGRCADALKIVEPLRLLDGGALNVNRGEDLTESVIFLAPTLQHER